MKTGLENSELKEKATVIARALVRKHGYEKFRLSDVAKELNISHAALYKYFQNKDELLDSVNAEWLQEIDDALQEIVDDTTIDAKTRIKRWFVRLYSMKREKVIVDLEPYAIHIAAGEQQKPYIKRHLQKQREQMLSMTKETFPNRDTETTATQILEATLLYHYPQLVKNGMDRERSKDLEALLDVLLDGMDQ